MGRSRSEHSHQLPRLRGHGEQQRWKIHSSHAAREQQKYIPRCRREFLFSELLKGHCHTCCLSGWWSSVSSGNRYFCAQILVALVSTSALAVDSSARKDSGSVLVNVRPNS